LGYNRRVMDFPLITFNPDTGLAEVGIPSAPRALRGIKALVQIVVLAVLKNGGQDVLTPDEGSGLRSLIGQYNLADPNEIKTEIIQRINLIENQIITNQTGFIIPASEKLKKLTILEIASDSLTGATAVRLQIFNEAGQQTTTVV
jgi:hypothetical protein